MITPHNLVKHELIGLECRIADSANRQNIGMKGKVVDESRQTLSLEIKGKTKSFIKDQCVFAFKIPNPAASGKPAKKHVWVRVDGRLLVARPEDRIKKKLRKW